MEISEAEIRELFERYETASSTKVFSNVAAMIHPDATYWFTDGSFPGLDAIKGAFEKTWASAAKVIDERYEISELHVVTADTHSASVRYRFDWSGKIDGKQPFSVHGRGTNVIVRNGDALQFIHEHLSR
jgi:ketosteroid isomerase-like protein